MVMSRKDLEISAIPSSLAQQKLVDLLSEAAHKVISMFRELELLLNKTESEEEVINKLRREKNDIEELKKEIFSYISRVAVSLSYKDEWIRLASKISSVADKIMGVAYRFEQMRIREWEPPRVIRENMKSFTEILEEMSQSLYKAFVNVNTEPSHTLNYCEKIEDMERKLDKKYRELLFMIVESNLDSRAAIIVKDIVDMLEELSDTIFYTTDDLRILVSSLI
ncbi:MAG: hypothetical protein DRN04_03190 [Thermoprotei archaeon]|nr:MAG: hypothetical protein DRN04_03190 [Thermoprotei archaeon]